MNYVVAILVIGLSTYLFKRASGTLKINLLNTSNFVFYSLLVFEFIGVTLVYLGFRDHYLIQRISSDETINNTYWCMAYTMIVLPIAIILANKFLFKIKDIKSLYLDNLKEETSLENKNTQNKFFVLIVVGLLICLIATIYVFYCIGYVPLFKYLDSSFDFATERVNVNRNFDGNIYVKNIIMLIITPILSYIAYIYMRTTKEKKWIILFAISFILNIFIKTYDFSKSPLIYYICYFFIIEVMLGKTFKLKKVIPFIIVAITLVVIFYTVIMGYDGKLISLSNGPLSRVFISQAGALFLHFDAFPDRIDYLNGHSFPPFTKIFFGEGEYDVRSGREVMELYNPTAVENGTAGVLSTVFLGEAYANFGLIGVIVAPIIVGIIFSAILCIYLKSKKTPLNIILYLECFIIFTTVLQGGFVEFFYNIQFIVTLIVIFGFKILSCDNIKEKSEKLFEKLKLKKN